MFETADLVLEGGVRAFLMERRAMRVPYREIADELRTHKIVVTHETVRAWVKRVEEESAEGAA